MDKLRAAICPKCGSKGLGPIDSDDICLCGGKKIRFNVTKDEYVNMSDSEIEKMIADMNLEPPLIPSRDVSSIYRATNSTEVIDAMIELRKKDIIEYNLKLSEFRAQNRQRAQIQAKQSNQVSCPRCDSTSISTTNRGFSMLTGFIGSGSPRNVCQRCGYKWRP